MSRREGKKGETQECDQMLLNLVENGKESELHPSWDGSLRAGFKEQGKEVTSYILYQLVYCYYNELLEEGYLYREKNFIQLTGLEAESPSSTAQILARIHMAVSSHDAQQWWKNEKKRSHCQGTQRGMESNTFF